MSITAAAGGVLKGLLTEGGVSAPDLTALFQTIDSAGANQRDLINALPAELQKQYAEYKTSNTAAIGALQTGTAALGEKLKAETAALYGPNAPAVQAAMDASKTAIYAELPGQQAAIRQALAATGGFDRGTAGKQLAAPVLQAGQQYGQQVANITAQQLQQKQKAEQNAITTINSMDENTLRAVFGMNKEQALMIMNSNRQDLKDQMTDLVTQSTQQTQQKLGVQGMQIQNQYQADVAKKAQKDAMTGAWIDLGAEAIDGGISAAGGWKGISQGLSGQPAGYNPNISYDQVMNPNLYSK